MNSLIFVTIASLVACIGAVRMPCGSATFNTCAPRVFKARWTLPAGNGTVAVNQGFALYNKDRDVGAWTGVYASRSVSDLPSGHKPCASGTNPLAVCAPAFSSLTWNTTFPHIGCPKSPLGVNGAARSQIQFEVSVQPGANTTNCTGTTVELWLEKIQAGDGVCDEPLSDVTSQCVGATTVGATTTTTKTTTTTATVKTTTTTTGSVAQVTTSTTSGLGATTTTTGGVTGGESGTTASDNGTIADSTGTAADATGTAAEATGTTGAEQQQSGSHASITEISMHVVAFFVLAVIAN